MPGPIVVAHHPTREERAPAEFAVAVAGHTGAAAIAVSFVEIVTVDGRLANPPEMFAADESLARLREELDVETRVLVDASPAHAIHRFAEQVGAELIVVGPTRRGPVGRVVPGSTAEQLVHGAPCPVAMVPEDWSAHALESVAVGFVDTPEGRAALHAAGQIAHGAGAALRVIMAVPGTTGVQALNLHSVPRDPTQSDLERDHTQAETALGAALARFAPAGVPELHVDDPARVLLRVSEHVDLLICGSRGYGSLLGVALGSVSRHVIDHARCPVLVVPRGVEQPLVGLLAEREEELT
jgi:nucleotide-binding universal stress UspA family protein